MSSLICILLVQLDVAQKNLKKRVSLKSRVCPLIYKGNSTFRPSNFLNMRLSNVVFALYFTGLIRRFLKFAGPTGQRRVRSCNLYLCSSILGEVYLPLTPSPGTPPTQSCLLVLGSLLADLPGALPWGVLGASGHPQTSHDSSDAPPGLPRATSRPPKTAPGPPKIAPGPLPRRSRRAPRPPQTAPGPPKIAPGPPQDPPSSPQYPPRWHQDPPRAPQDPPEPSKIAPNPSQSSQTPPRPPQKTLKTHSKNQ